jgi:hypothetical protein
MEQRRGKVGTEMKWITLRGRNTKFPVAFEAADTHDLLKQVTAWADETNLELDVDEMTDQIDLFYYRGPRTYRLATLIPGE